MRVLGINFGHGAAAALICDGQIVAAIEEEKLNRQKGYVGFPFLSFEFVLSQKNVTVDDIDYVVIGSENISEFCYTFRHLLDIVFGYDDQAKKRNIRLRWTSLKASVLDLLKRKFYFWDNSEALENFFYYLLYQCKGISQKKIIKVNHHLAHAASAFGCAPWQGAVVITADGKGDGLCGGFYQGDGKTLTCIDTVSQDVSVGQLYQAVTKFLGYKPNRHEGKITGLAALGTASETKPIFEDLLRYNNEGVLQNTFYTNEAFLHCPVSFYEKQVPSKDFIADNYVRSLNGRLRHFAIIHQLYQVYFKKHLRNFEPADIAAGVQAQVEEILSTYVTKQLSGYESCHVCLAGGVFANVKINQKIRELPSVNGFYVHPAMDDAGCALGAAIHVANVKGKSVSSLKHVYLGPAYSDQDIEVALQDTGLKYERVRQPEQEVAQFIADGKIVGRYNGALEWGPRALGNRSILVQPTDKAINEQLNERLHRTEFMPFAPTILQEYARDYLVGYRESDYAARYMTVTYHIKPSLIPNIAAAVHVDGTARPQVLYQADNPSFHKILMHYYHLTGIPAVINTSFNMHEEPIVNTPEDAIRAYCAGAVDVLSLGSYIVQ